MTNQLQDAVLSAIDTLVNNRIDKMQVDKTVTATIVKCTNSITGEYLCSYNGGNLYAYALENASYTTGSTVYVLVPLGDFSKKKTIVSKAQALEDDSNISFVSSALSNYNLLGKNPVEDDDNNLPVGMSSYIKDNYILLYDRDNRESSLIDFNDDEFFNGLKQAEAVLIEASFKTRLDNAHRLGKRGYYGLQFVLAFSDKDQVDADGNSAVKEYAYVLESHNMNGNPFLFTTWSEQYSIFDIDIENFLYVKSIMVFCNDFEDADNIQKAELWGEDVFVKNIEIYGLKTISAQNGDYIMTLSSPQGITFKSTSHADSLSVIGTMKKQLDNLSDQAMWYWFAEDARVTPGADGYQMYGGSGWRYLEDKNNTYNFYTYGDENKAYENKYLCVAVYKETMILKEEFTIYNDSVKRDLSITSNMGVKFSFDRGTPTLTCLVDGKESGFESDKEGGRPDSWFKFIWSRVDKGTVISFEYTAEQLEEQIAELKKQYDSGIASGIGYVALQSIQSNINILQNRIDNQLVGATFEPGSNVFTYSVRQIETSAVFRCTVYTRDSSVSDFYNIGTAEITLQNEGAAEPNSYYIIIENGEQVFQYSESGVSPADTRYENPLEVKPLTCHFYDPVGIEVNNKTYQVKWQVPLENTMIVTPNTESMTINPVNSRLEWCTSEMYPLAIESDYNYQALNNQIKCIVTYYGQEYTEYTNLLFTKVGENGTNGTDIVAKISPTSDSPILDVELLALEISVANDNKESYTWNTGQAITDKVLDFSLFQRNEEITAGSVDWTISGGTGNNNKYMGVSNGIVSWDSTDALSRKYRNQIVKASTKVDVSDDNLDRNNSEYYAFYPVPVVYYYTNTAGQTKRYHISIDSTKTLRSITYNADGRNPLYNKNQGVSISLGDIDISQDNPKYIVWRAEGGQPEGQYLDNPPNAAFKLTYAKNSKDGLRELTPRTIDVEADIENGVEAYSYTELLTEVYILPDDTYDGAYANNLVHGLIYSSKQSYENGSNPEVEIYIPIYMSLNRFGLQSLNAWDGNHLEINEDKDYILAPQIGAGAKDANNAFTGIVMGTAKTYDKEEADIGLLGYSHGEQSIFLNAEDGSAIFGLPEDSPSANNHYTQGRIELIPGGDSQIGMWTIGSRALYNVSDPVNGGKVLDGKEIEVLEGGRTQERNIVNGVLQPYFNYPVEGAQIATPHKAQGIILNANPAYISVKGKPLNKENSEIQWDAANTTIKLGDSLEVEIDPTKSSVFSIYRHTMYDEVGQLTDTWRRYPLVGINENGQFYTNAIEDGKSSMGIGYVGAFKDSAANHKYVGAQFGYDSTNLFKFFIEPAPEGQSNERQALHISTGTNISDKTASSAALEYARPIKIYGDSITLYAPDQNRRNVNTSSHRISISDTEAFLGHDVSYFKITSSSLAELNVNSRLNIKTPTNQRTDFTTGQFNLSTQNSIMSAPDINFKSKQDITNIVGRDFVVDASKGDFSFESQYFTMESTNTGSPRNLTLTDKDKTVYLKLNKSSMSYLHNDYGFNLTSKTGAINISNNSAQGITINAKAPGNGTNDYVKLTMIAQDGGSASYFALSSQNGSIKATQNLWETNSGISITNGFGTGWGVFTDTLTDDSPITILSERDIVSQNGWMYAGDFSFNTEKSFDYWNGTAKGTQISTFLENIYSLLKDLRSRMSTAEGDIDKAQATADSAYSLASGKADASHTHSDYLLRKDFSGHTHPLLQNTVVTQIDWDTYYKDGVGDISHIKNVWKSRVSTQGPVINY